MPIPVLNENQMTALKGVLNGGKTIDLTGGGGSSTRLPTMPEEAEVIVKGSSYNGPFAVRKVGEVMVDISSGEIIPSESGTISAALVTVKNGIITVGDSSWWTTAGPADTSALAIPLPENYTLYLVNSFTSEPAYPHYNNGYEFKALLGAPLIHDDVSYTRLAKNEGGVVKQIQYGDITDLPQFHIPVSASSAWFAESARYHGHFAVDFTPNYGVVIDSANETASCQVYIGNNVRDAMHYGSNVAVPMGGYVVQGDNHIAMSDEILSFTIDLSSNTEADSYNIYLYKDNTSSAFKYAAIPRKYNAAQVPLDRATFGNTFYTQLATVRVWRSYAGVDEQGNYKYNYSSSVVQTQFGDVVDCDYGYDDDYLGAFHVRINSDSITSSDGVISGTLDVHDDYAVPTLEDILGSAGKIVQGAERTVVSHGFQVPFKYYTAYDLNPTNVYLYEDVNSTGDGRWKFFAVDRILRDHPEDIPISGFCTRIATIGGLGVGKPICRQQQYGDVVDVAVGGSTTIINSSSITSTIIHSSSVYSSTIVNSSTIINSSSFALEYKGHFCVSGAIESAGTPQEAFIATVYDGTNPNGQVAGEVIVGNTVSTAGKSSITCPIGSSVYLIGTVNGNSVSVEYSACGAAPSVQENQFYTQLACNSGGTMTQMQYGDIVQPVKVGATGVTRLIAGTPNVTLSPETGTGEVTINVTGGTGGGGGSLSYVCIGEEPDTETGIINAQANTAYFIAIFGDLYYDEEDGYICQYYYTVDYSVTPQVYTRHKTDYNDLESYSAGYGYSMELVLPAPSEDSIIEICLFAYTSVLISSTKPIRNYQGTPPINQPYPITNRNVKFVYIAEDHGGTWYMYGN